MAVRTVLVFGAFGWVTPEKRVPQIVRTMASLADKEPNAHLLLVGSPVDHYDVRADLQAAGLDGRVTLAGYVDDDADVYRDTSPRPTSVSVCDGRRCAKPPPHGSARSRPERPRSSPISYTITMFPCSPPPPPGHGPRRSCTAAPLPLRSRSPSTSATRGARFRPPCWHCCGTPLRQRLGAAARAYWQANFRMDRSAEDYERVMCAAAARPPGRPALPPHLDDDGGRSAQEILKPFGVMPNFLRRDGSD